VGTFPLEEVIFKAQGGRGTGRQDEGNVHPMGYKKRPQGTELDMVLTGHHKNSILMEEEP